MERTELLGAQVEREVVVLVRGSGREPPAQALQERALAVVVAVVVLVAELRVLQWRTVVGAVHRRVLRREAVRETPEEQEQGLPVDRMGLQVREGVLLSSWVER